MSYYDVTARIPAGEGQGNEGGADRYELCVNAWGGVIGIIYCGVDPYEPQEMRHLSDPNNHGGESFQLVANWMEAHRRDYPGLPQMEVENPGDLAGRIRALASQQWLMGIAVSCNSSAQIVPGGRFGHCAGIAAVRDDGVTLWANGFYGGEVNLTWPQLKAVYIGGLWVCQAPIPGPTQLPNTNLEDDVSKGASYVRADGMTVDWYVIKDGQCYHDMSTDGGVTRKRQDQPPGEWSSLLSAYSTSKVTGFSGVGKDGHSLWDCFWDGQRWQVVQREGAV